MCADNDWQRVQIGMPMVPLYADPCKYRTRGRQAVMILVDLVTPVLVALFGLMTSLCTLTALVASS